MGRTAAPNPPGMENSGGQYNSFGDNLLDREAGYAGSSPSPRHATQAGAPSAGGGSDVSGIVESIGGWLMLIDIGSASVLGAAMMQDCDGCSWHYTYAIIASIVSLVFSIAHSVIPSLKVQQRTRTKPTYNATHHHLTQKGHLISCLAPPLKTCRRSQ